MGLYSSDQEIDPFDLDTEGLYRLRAALESGMSPSALHTVLMRLPANTPEDPTDRLIDLVYAPKAQYRPNARFVMNRRTVSAVRKFKDADGNYIWQPASRAGETASLLGYPVTEIETTLMPWKRAIPQPACVLRAV